MRTRSKIMQICIIAILLLTVILSYNNTYATTEEEELNLGLTLWRQNDDNYYRNHRYIDQDKANGIESEGDLVGYVFGNTNLSADTTKRIWKIVQQNGTNLDYSKSIYCLKAGVGFTSLENTTTTENSEKYDKKLDMLNSENKAEIMKLLNVNEATYHKILWIIDKTYVPSSNTATTDREELLGASGVKDLIETYKEGLRDNNQGTEEEIETLDITDNDIDVVQQMAIWYYTNPGEVYETNELVDLKTAYKDGYEEVTGLTFKNFTDQYNYSEFSNGISWEYYVGKYRQDFCETLFSYLVSNADENFNLETTSKTATFWTNQKDYNNIEKIANKTEDYSVQPVVVVKKEEKYFDLALRKFITQVSDGRTFKDKYYRVPSISEEQIQKLANGDIKTVEKEHDKTPVSVNTGDIVTYTIRIYNEGSISGYANEVTDYLPSGLELIDPEESEINKTYGWKCYDGKTVTTDYLKNKKINAFDGTNIAYEDLKIECKVVEKNSSTQKTLRNVAEITKAKDEDGKDMNLEGDDRDSIPNNLSNDQKQNYNPGTSEKGYGYEDDDDYEDLLLPGQEVDLALRKFITAVGENELVDENGKYLREPEVKTYTIEDSGTATYYHTKMPLTVKVGDVVTYTIRVYNEGSVDGYVSEITDHLPQWLEYIYEDEDNIDYQWEMDDNRTIKTSITSKNKETSYLTDCGDREGRGTTLLTAWDGTEDKLDYIDVKIKCKVIDTVGNATLKQGEKITNIADITGMTDASETPVSITTDRDSTVNNVRLPSDEELPEYKQDEINVNRENEKYYIPGQQDDDDFEKVVVQSFDLALRKFITDVSGMPVNNRYPSVSYNQNESKLVYTHPKTPVDVAYKDVVTYTLRIYNEGTIDGYAQEVTDDLPDYLTYLPDNEINKQYGWKMYREIDPDEIIENADEIVVRGDKKYVEVTEVSQADIIATDYLSKEKGMETTVTNEDGTTTTTNSNLLKAFDKDMPVSDTNPDYRELKIAMRVDLQVTQDNLEDSKRILINEAQISEDADAEGNPVDDVDSTPNRDDKYNYDGENEDDIDYEPVKVKYFDLALKKWVTQAIVTEDGKTTITESGHTGDENPEPALKVEIKSKNINKVNVKFRFNIKVTNEGEIAGYATEVTDHIPEGLSFVQEDNPEWYTKDGNLVATRALENTLLQPGESATVDIILEWVNGNNNFGLKTNYAEISEDYNSSGTPDIDSTPGNLEGTPKEDDEDQAPVVLSIKTGEAPIYFALTSSIIGMFTGGVWMIKKYVL